jgi:hypothetical protein
MVRETQINWVKFGFGLLCTAVLSLSVHTVMLQELHIPFPDISVIAKPYLFTLRALSVLGLIYFWEMAQQNVSSSFWKKWLLLFLIDAMLTESLFRASFMDGYCTNAIGYMLISNVPKLLSIAVVCALVVFMTSKINKSWQKLVVAIIITAIYIFIITPLFGLAWHPVMTSVARFEPTSEWCRLPYGPDVLIPAYISYIEPVIGCSIMALLIWHQLPKTKWLKYILFIVMVLAIKNQLLSPVFYAFLNKSNFFSNLVSEGQFALEAIALAMLTGFTINYSSKHNLKIIDKKVAQKGHKRF